MIELNLTQHRKARVWLNDLPDVRSKLGKSVNHSIPAGRGTFQETRRAAVEILIPRGPRALYGLLGAELRPKPSNSLVVNIVTSEEHTKPYLDSIAISSDTSYVGLPLEFSNAVFEGANEEIQKIGNFCAGELSIEFAVHGTVGSAPVIFRWLATSLVDILVEGNNISQQRLVEILQRPL